MRLPSVDHSATSGSSWLHRASISDKVSLPLTGFGVAAISSSPVPLMSVYAVLMIVAWSASLPLARIVMATILPVPMVGLYALSHWQSDWSVIVVILAKGVVTVEASLADADDTGSRSASRSDTVAAGNPQPEPCLDIPRRLHVMGPVGERTKSDSGAGRDKAPASPRVPVGGVRDTPTAIAPGWRDNCRNGRHPCN